MVSDVNRALQRKALEVAKIFFDFVPRAADFVQPVTQAVVSKVLGLPVLKATGTELLLLMMEVSVPQQVAVSMCACVGGDVDGD